MVKDFSISLFVPEGRKVFFNSGESISGLLHFTLSEAKNYERIQIGFYGGALVRWSESQGNNGSVTYTSKETYVNQAMLLWSCEQEPQGKIGPGTYAMPFQFEIPNTCIGSFKDSFGSIFYAIRANIKTPGLLHRDHNIEVPVDVIRIRDINLPHLSEPIQSTKQKIVGFFSFGSLIKFTASLNRTGFCIGHNLPLTVRVMNGCSRQIKMRASIQRICTYHAQGHTRPERRKLVATLSPNIAGHSQYTWSLEDLIVPMVDPSFEGSQIIKMQYFVKVTAVIPWAFNSSVMIPITLGNVPLNNY